MIIEQIKHSRFLLVDNTFAALGRNFTKDGKNIYHPATPNSILRFRRKHLYIKFMNKVKKCNQ